MKLSVIIPVHNEADNIPNLVKEITQVLDSQWIPLPISDHEIVVVDDGSDDATVERLRSLQRYIRNLRIIQHRQRSGQSTALRTGVRYATGEVLATLDGDGQNDPADIPRLLASLLALDVADRVDLVVGNRSQRRRDSWWRRMSSRVANSVRSRILGDATPDTGCGLKVLRRATFLELPYFDHMHRFLPALVRRHGGSVLSVPVNHRPRTRGASHYGTVDRLIAGIIDLAGMMWLLHRVKLPQTEECVRDESRNDMALGGNSRTVAVHEPVRRAVA